MLYNVYKKELVNGAWNLSNENLILSNLGEDEAFAYVKENENTMAIPQPGIGG